MKKNVWIMNHYAGSMFFDQGGRHYNFAKYLKRLGYEPVVFCANSKHGPAEHWFADASLWHEHKAEELDVPFVFVASRTYVGNGKQRIMNMADFYRNVKRAAREYAAQHGTPDIILASSVHPLTLVAGIQLAKAFRVKCICEVRDLWPESLVAYGIAGARNPAVIALRWLEKWVYRKAYAVVFTMEGAYDYIIERGWVNEVPQSKVHYINNGVDLEVFRYNREHYQVRDEDLENPDIFKVVYTGSIRKVNNLELLLDAAKEVINPRVKFLIWGDGEELPELQQRVVDENIKNIVFKGRVDKKFVPYIVSGADLNIAHNTPSPLFRFGISFNKVFDYLAAGKPVLSDFPCPYNPAVMCNAGRTVEEPTAKSIAEEIEHMKNLPFKQYQAYCDSAARAAKKYCFEELAKQLLAVIEGE